ncbi:MAG: PstC family ABC transporter permease, partial [Gammaproteobacteria bacterium]
MSSSLLFVLLVALSVLAFQLGKARAIAVVGGLRGVRDLHSLPGHYGLLTAIWCGLPALVVFALWVSLQDVVITQLVLADLPANAMAQSAQALALMLNDLRNVVAGNVPAEMVAESTRVAAAEYLKLQRIAQLALTVVTFAVGIAGLLVVRARIRPDLRARNAYERVIEWALFACSAVAVLTTIGIVLSIVFEATRFFNIVPITEFVFGTNWSPQMAIRADQVGSSGAFGAVPLFAGTLLISFIAMIVAVPIGLFSAIYLAEYAPLKVRKVVKPLLEVLAGVPTVVYGFFAVTTVGPALRVAGEAFGLPVAGESALAAGL